MKKIKKFRTKIVATIGPASSNPKILERLIKSGLDVVRINFSHGNYDEYREIIKNVRDISKRLGKPVAILQDLRGPKLRVGIVKNGEIELKRGSIVEITTDNIEGDENRIPTDFKSLPRYVKEGERILLDDGNIELKVLKVNRNAIVCKVVYGGILKSRKGLNLPQTKLNIPALTEKDKKDALFGVENEVDYIALSFVQKAKDVKELKEILKSEGADIPVIAKIEKPSGVENLNSILKVADGIMVARGDLGVEMKEEMVPVLQKEIIDKANRAGKLVITATQMLESMIEKPRPTRAETTDIANAIFDGTDAVMLSAETAVGKYPEKAVKTMGEIAKISEESNFFKVRFSQGEYCEKKVADAIVRAAVVVSEELNAKLIMVFTWSGSTALKISKFKPKTPIVAFTPDKKVLNRMSLFWGVTPMLLEYTQNTDVLIAKAESMLLDERIIKEGDIIIVVGGVTPVKGATNMLKVLRV